MVFESRLHDEPFKLIKLGSKTIELRVYDEKRREMQVGDYLYFTNRVTGEKKPKLLLYIFINLLMNYTMIMIKFL